MWTVCRLPFTQRLDEINHGVNFAFWFTIQNMNAVNPSLRKRRFAIAEVKMPETNEGFVVPECPYFVEPAHEYATPVG